MPQPESTPFVESPGVIRLAVDQAVGSFATLTAAHLGADRDTRIYTGLDELENGIVRRFKLFQEGALNTEGMTALEERQARARHAIRFVRGETRDFPRLPMDSQRMYLLPWKYMQEHAFPFYYRNLRLGSESEAALTQKYQSPALGSATAFLEILVANRLRTTLRGRPAFRSDVAPLHDIIGIYGLCVMAVKRGMLRKRNEANTD